MGYAKKIVLNSPRGYHEELDGLIEKFISDGVIFVGVVGVDCSRVEDIIDQLVVGDGTHEERSLLTSSHPGESVEQALEFANSLTGGFAGEVQIVQL